MLTITLRHFAAMREQRGTPTEQVEVPAGTTLSALYASLFGTPSGPLPVACMRNRVASPPDTVLADGDEVAFLPPFGGG